MNNPLDDFLNFCGKHCFLFLSLLLTTLAFISSFLIYAVYPSRQIYYLDLSIWAIAAFLCLPLHVTVTGILQHKLPTDEKSRLRHKFVLRILVTDALPIAILFVVHLLLIRSVPWLFILFALMDASHRPPNPQHFQPLTNLPKSPHSGAILYSSANCELYSSA